MSVVEKELNFGDHGYARRTPLPGLEEEDTDRTAEDQQPCTQCQLLKKQLEQEMQHTARLQKEVGQQLVSLATNHDLLFFVLFSFEVIVCCVLTPIHHNQIKRAHSVVIGSDSVRNLLGCFTNHISFNHLVI